MKKALTMMGRILLAALIGAGSGGLMVFAIALILFELLDPQDLGHSHGLVIYVLAVPGIIVGGLAGAITAVVKLLIAKPKRPEPIVAEQRIDTER